MRSLFFGVAFFCTLIAVWVFATNASELRSVGEAIGFVGGLAIFPVLFALLALTFKRKR